MEFVKGDISYLAASDDYHGSNAVLLGLPMDWTVSFGAGANEGPCGVREVSDVLETYSPQLDMDLEDISLYDMGDLVLPEGDVMGALSLMEDAAKKVIKDKKFLLSLGGDHLVSYPLIKAYYEQYPNMVLIQLDAHADLREEYHGRYSHATVIKRVLDFMEPSDVYQFGIRSGCKEEWQFGEDNTKFHPFSVYEPLVSVLDEIGDRPVYLTIDIDVVDPTYAPGTGTPEPLGIDTRELFASIYALSQKKVVGMDIVELSPPLDSANITSILVAKMVRECLLLFS